MSPELQHQILTQALALAREGLRAEERAPIIAEAWATMIRWGVEPDNLLACLGQLGLGKKEVQLDFKPWDCDAQEERAFLQAIKVLGREEERQWSWVSKAAILTAKAKSLVAT